MVNEFTAYLQRQRVGNDSFEIRQKFTYIRGDAGPVIIDYPELLSNID